jgi:hypothetical protein
MRAWGSWKLHSATGSLGGALGPARLESMSVPGLWWVWGLSMGTGLLPQLQGWAQLSQGLFQPQHPLGQD